MANDSKAAPICLACDLQPNSGEGSLALYMLKMLMAKKSSVCAKSNQSFYRTR